MDYNLPVSSVHWILQSRILEYVAIPSSKGIFPTQGSNPCLLQLLHCRQNILLLSHWGIPKLIEFSILIICISIKVKEKIWWLTHEFSSVQSLNHVWLFATPWIAAHQASLSITSSQSLLELMPIESVMPSSHLILCRPLLLLPPIPPSIRVFSSESKLFTWGGQSIGVSASTSILPMNTQDWTHRLMDMYGIFWL